MFIFLPSWQLLSCYSFPVSASPLAPSSSSSMPLLQWASWTVPPPRSRGWSLPLFPNRPSTHRTSPPGLIFTNQLEVDTFCGGIQEVVEAVDLPVCPKLWFSIVYATCLQKQLPSFSTSCSLDCWQTLHILDSWRIIGQQHRGELELFLPLLSGNSQGPPQSTPASMMRKSLKDGINSTNCPSEFSEQRWPCCARQRRHCLW